MKIDIKKQDIKMRVTPEQSKKVQEICFELGGVWDDTLEKDLKYTNDPFLYLTGLRLFRGLDSQCFLEDKDLEVSAKEFIRTKGFTEKPKKDKNKDVSKKILKKFIKRIKKEQKNKMFSEVTTYNKCADILKDIVLEVSKGKKGKKK